MKQLLFKSILFICLLSISNFLIGQDTKVNWQLVNKEIGHINQLHIDLYRGWVELLPSDNTSLELKYSVFDYDHYYSTKKFIPFSKNDNRNQAIISEEDKMLSITNGSSREIIVLKIRIPRSLNVIVDINHFGFVKSSGISGEQEVNIFSGKIELFDLSTSASAHIVRDGDIKVVYYQVPKNTYSAYSVYDGDIQIGLPTEIACSFEASSDLGVVNDEFNLKWQQENPREYTLKKPDGSTEQKISYTQKASINKDLAQFFLKTIHGDIMIQKSQ